MHIELPGRLSAAASPAAPRRGGCGNKRGMASPGSKNFTPYAGNNKNNQNTHSGGLTPFYHIENTRILRTRKYPRQHDSVLKVLLSSFFYHAPLLRADNASIYCAPPQRHGALSNVPSNSLKFYELKNVIHQRRTKNTDMHHTKQRGAGKWVSKVSR